jgi:tetratricopeptide (TPR) repeat protein
MRLKASPCWILILLLAVCFTLATALQLRVAKRNNPGQSNNVFKLFMGEGQRLFAHEFYVMADVYFHNGYYPSIFDKQESQSDVLGAVRGQSDDDEDTTNVVFFGAPRDWIDSFGWRFRLHEHTHLSSGDQREILPWLQLAADMDPQMVQTYTVAAFWLRTSLHNPKEAEAFLREGLRNNPDNCEILFELGRLYNEDYHDVNRARNVWSAALRYWRAQSDEAKKSVENKRLHDAMLVNLAYLEENAGNWLQAIEYFEMAKQVSPTPDAIQKRIDEARQKLAERPPASNAPAAHY